jgi:hypothetical protein
MKENKKAINQTGKSKVLSKLTYPLLFFGLALFVIESAFLTVLINLPTSFTGHITIVSFMVLSFLITIVIVAFLVYTRPTHIMLRAQDHIKTEDLRIDHLLKVVMDFKNKRQFEAIDLSKLFPDLNPATPKQEDRKEFNEKILNEGISNDIIGFDVKELRKKAGIEGQKIMRDFTFLLGSSYIENNPHKAIAYGVLCMKLMDSIDEQIKIEWDKEADQEKKFKIAYSNSTPYITKFFSEMRPHFPEGYYDQDKVEKRIINPAIRSLKEKISL